MSTDIDVWVADLHETDPDAYLDETSTYEDFDFYGSVAQIARLLREHHTKYGQCSIDFVCDLDGAITGAVATVHTIGDIYTATWVDPKSMTTERDAERGLPSAVAIATALANIYDHIIVNQKSGDTA